MFTTIQKFLSKISPFIIAATIILGTSIVFSKLAYNYANSKSIIITLGFAIIIAIAGIIVPLQEFKNITKSKIFWGTGALLVVAVLATLTSIDPMLSWFSHLERGSGTIYLVTVILGAFAAILIARHTNTVRKAILYPLVISSSIIALSTIVGYTGFNITNARVVSNVAGGGGLIGNSSLAATYIMMMFFVVVYLFVTTNDSWKKWLLGILGIVTIFNPVIFGYAMFREHNYSLLGLIGDARGAAISLAFGFVVMVGIYLAFHSKKTVQWVGKVIAGGMVAITLGALAMLAIPGNSVHDFFNKEASGTRFLYWNIALQSTRDHLILGTGPETFRHAHEHYFDSNFMRKTFKRELYSDKPHNAYLETLSTQGVLGGIAYIVFIGSIIWVLRRKSKDANNKYLVATFSGLLFAYLLNNFILFDTNISYMALFLLLGWLASEDIGEASEGNLSESEPIRYVFIASGIIIAATVFVLIVPEIVKLKTILKEMYAPLDQRIGLYEKSEAISPFGAAVTISQRADVYTQNYLAHMNEVLLSDKLSQQQVLADVDSIGKELLIAFSKYHPTTQGYVAYARLGSIKVLLLDKPDPDAVQQIIDGATKAIALSPTNPQAYWMLGQAYAYMGKYDLSLAEFNKALAINPKVPESYLSIIELAKISRNQKLLTETEKSYLANTDPADR